MSIKLKVRQGGGTSSQPDLANLAEVREGVPIFDDTGTPIVDLAQRWEHGQAAQGSYTYVDVDGSSSYFHRAHAEVKLIEDDSGNDMVLAWGRMEGGNDTGRGVARGGHGEVYHSAIQFMDCNADLRGLPFRTEWVRPAETSWERLQALAARSLSGASSTGTTRRKTTDITVDRFTNGHLVDATDPVDMDATTYPVGTTPLDVMEDIFSQWEGKGWGVTLHHGASSTHKCLLVLEPEDNSTFTSDLKISDELDDWDPDDATAPVLVPEWRRGAGKTSDNAEVISGLISIWGGTTDNPRSVYVETADSEDDWETWVDVFNDDVATSEVQAERRANAILQDRKRPYVTPQPSITLNPDQVTLITAGQSIEVKSVVINQGPDRHDYQWWRIAEIRWEPLPDGRWLAHLELGRGKNAAAGNGGGGHPQPGSTSPKPPPICAEPGSEACSVLAADGSGATAYYNPAPAYRDTPAGNPDDAFIPYLHIGATSTKNLLADWCGGTEIVAGGTYVVQVRFRTNSYYGVYRLKLFHNGDDSLGTDDGTRIAYLYPHHDNTEYTLTSDQFTIPSDATSATIALESTYGGWQWKDFIVLDYTDPGNDEFCVPEGSYDPDDPYYSPGNHNHDGTYAPLEHRHSSDTLDIGWKAPVRVATTSSHTLSSAYEDGDTIDGVTLAAGDRILIKDQSTGAQNGIYLVQESGAPTRATDFDTTEEIPGAMVRVMEGTTNADTVWGVTNDDAVLDTDDQEWEQLSGGGGSGHTIKEDGTPLTARAGLNFGSGIVASDDAGNDETDVDLDWAEAGDLSTQAMGDSTSAGTSQEVPRGDHKHAMPAFGTTTQPVGTAAGGSATTPSKSDHVHATGAGTPSTQAFGDAASTGTGPAAAMTDHKHAMPADPVTAHVAASDPHTGYVLESLLDAKGDLIAASADNTPAKVTVGTNGYALLADSSAGAGVAWAARYASLTMIIGSGSAVISTGVKGYIRVPFACTIVRESILADRSGAIKLDVWNDTFAHYPPTDADSITGGNEPEIAASGTTDEDTTLTSWSKDLAEGDVIGVNVDSCSTIQQVTFELRVRLTA